MEGGEGDKSFLTIVFSCNNLIAEVLTESNQRMDDILKKVIGIRSCKWPGGNVYTIIQDETAPIRLKNPNGYYWIFICKQQLNKLYSQSVKRHIGYKQKIKKCALPTSNGSKAEAPKQNLNCLNKDSFFSSILTLFLLSSFKLLAQLLSFQFLAQLCILFRFVGNHFSYNENKITHMKVILVLLLVVAVCSL